MDNEVKCNLLYKMKHILHIYCLLELNMLFDWVTFCIKLPPGTFDHIHSSMHFLLQKHENRLK